MEQKNFLVEETCSLNRLMKIIQFVSKAPLSRMTMLSAL
ncbi:Uncharacterised protein [Mycobacterium tuberculosis]|nr:Uncharacterised protein [Mycobacterium tuberculosis]CKV29799.1 Uncharacterised protein [Mycobacterium tuberculosis]